MKPMKMMVGSAVLAFALTLSGPAWAQADIDFGDDTSTWANDGECDDPRFEGEGASAVASPIDEGRDATDCQAAYDAGTVTYAGADESAPEPTPAPTTGGEIDFGDDSGAWANDGECDDPRFGGMLDSHVRADATDCQTAYDAGDVTYLGENGTDTGEIDFGDDSGEYANDDECDDPRFAGSGVGVALDSHYMADATDCQTAYDAGTVTLAEESEPITIDGIDFGDDSGQWSNDGECDDPRFTGPGVGAALDDHYMADATDCSSAYQDGTVTLGEDGGDVRINFGDDSGGYANDGECDDPRFTGPGVGVALDDHYMADATDCQTAYDAGTVTLGDTDDDVRINFGDDSSATAYDGVCDDPRFQGRGAAPELYGYNALADATDCRAAYDAGTVSYDPQ